MSKQKVFMCPPDYYDIEYSINPWMNVENKAGVSKNSQWLGLKKKFEELGVEVILIDPRKGLPDMVFIDAGIIVKKNFIPSNFRYKERQDERKFFIDAFKRQGFKVEDIPKNLYFEGHGDTLWAGNKLFFGYGFRSSIEAQFYVQKILEKYDENLEVIPIELIDQRFYHLDTCFCPLDDKRAICYSGAFSEKARYMLSQNIDLIDVSEEDAKNFACNSVILDNDIIMPDNTNGIASKLRGMGYSVHQIPMTEFIKAGGACKCLSFVF